MASPFRTKSCLNLEVPKKRELNNKLISVGYYLRDHPGLLIATAIVAAGFIVSAIMLSLDPNFLKYYGDGTSHMVIARRVFDSLTPGLAQLGGVWLPMTHLLLMPFVANDFLFQTGLAGTIVSISATAVTAVALFRILQLQFASSVVGIFGSFLYFLNPSVIYMGVVPMMEALFMMFFILSVYYIQKWYYLSVSEQKIWIQYRTILKCALAVSAASLTRYEGWALPAGVIIILLFVQLFIQRMKWTEREKHRLHALLSVVLIFGFMGITLWIAWNLVIFNDPLYSLTGPYSASAQADFRGFNKDYKLNPVVSSLVIFDVAEEMYGLHVLAISISGIGVYLYAGAKRRRLTFHLLTVLMLMTPILLDFFAMVHGSGEIVPIGQSWFNGRYLIFIAPLLAFGSASLLNFVMEITRRKTLSVMIIAIVMIAGAYSFTFALQGLEYGKSVALNGYGLLPSNKQTQDAVDTGKQLGRIYEDENIVLFALASDSPWVMLESHIPLKKFIDLSNRGYWEISEQSPWIYGNYVVLQKQLDEMSYDPLMYRVNYWHVNKQTLLQHYDLIYENDTFEIFKRNY
jgi:hypothetical protein